MAFPPCPQGILPEPKRLNKRAAQPEAPHLVDDEAAQGDIVGIKEPTIR